MINERLLTQQALQRLNEIKDDTLDAMLADMHVQLIALFEERAKNEDMIVRATATINCMKAYKETIAKQLYLNSANQKEEAGPTKSDPQSAGPAHQPKGSGLITPR